MDKEMREACDNKLKNQLFNLLCEYEEKGAWEACLDAIIIELMGYSEERKTINYYKLLNKVNSLRFLNYKYFRTTIFDCMNLVSKT